VPNVIAGSTFSDNCTHDHDLLISQAPAAGTVAPLGTTTITVFATDESGNTGSASTSFTVQDTTPPQIANLTATPSTLWAPNHKLEPVSISAATADACTQPPACRIVSVTSNEPSNGKGDGNTDPDWVYTGDLSLLLRAERSGTGTGRVYTIGVSCTDAAGNVSETRTVIVTGSHDQKK